MDDAELVDGLKNGDVLCQIALLERYQDRLAEIPLRFRRLDEGDAEHIATEVLYQLVLDPSIIDLSKGYGTLDGLVFKMAKNRAIDLHHKKGRAFGGRGVVSLEVHIPVILDTSSRRWRSPYPIDVGH
jgi:hypothetical protein